MTVHLATNSKGEVIGAFSKHESAFAKSEGAVVSWIIDMPEAGPLIRYKYPNRASDEGAVPK